MNRLGQAAQMKMVEDMFKGHRLGQTTSSPPKLLILSGILIFLLGSYLIFRRWSR